MTQVNLTLSITTIVAPPSALSLAAIIGIAVGSAAAVLILWAACCRKNRNASTSTGYTSQPASTPYRPPVATPYRAPAPVAQVATYNYAAGAAAALNAEKASYSSSHSNIAEMERVNVKTSVKSNASQKALRFNPATGMFE